MDPEGLPAGYRIARPVTDHLVGVRSARAAVLTLAVTLALFVPAARPRIIIAASNSIAGILLSGVSHALEGRTIIITGAVENRGPRPVSRLAIDATGFTPSGEPAFFGSDGVPWTIAPGTTERFSIRLPLAGQLIRHYTVQVSLVSALSRPLATTQRSVNPALYRDMLRTLVRVRGDILGDVLTVRPDAGGFPISQITVEATVSLPSLPHRFSPTQIVLPHTLERLVLDVAGEGSTSIRLRVGGGFLVGLRVLDVRLKLAWD
ncbi:MAG: hypothetical protein ACT4P5_11470 [Armatimonadota bacterium]